MFFLLKIRCHAVFFCNTISLYLQKWLKWVKLSLAMSRFQRKLHFCFKILFLCWTNVPIPELILAQNLQDYFLTKNNWLAGSISIFIIQRRIPVIYACQSSMHTSNLCMAKCRGTLKTNTRTSYSYWEQKAMVYPMAIKQLSTQTFCHAKVLIYFKP